MASGHDEAPGASGVQDQSERSEASTDKLIAQNAPHSAVAGGQPKAHKECRASGDSSAVAGGQPKALLKSNSS